jgi:hypothetical protein
MTKFGSLKNWTIQFAISEHPILKVSEKNVERAKLEDLKIQGVLKQEKGLEGIMGPRSQSRKYQTIRFAKPDYLVFPE